MADLNVGLAYVNVFSEVEKFITKKTEEKTAEANALERALKSTMKLISLFSNPSSKKQMDFLEDEKMRNHFNQLFIYNPSLINDLHPDAKFSEQQCKDIAEALKKGNTDGVPSALYLFDTKEFSRIVDILNNQKELIPIKISQKTSEISHEADNMTDFSRMATKALEKEDRSKARMVGNQRV
ncbi:MAG: hypothetical protein ACRDAI_02495 [Candidatus Rhabdochlamydia sp.]